MAIIKKFRIKSFKEQETLLQLDKVSMFYDERRILNDISFKVNRAEVLGLLGPNGVGKSTIFKIIKNIEQQKSGAPLFRYDLFFVWHSAQSKYFSSLFLFLFEFR